MTAPGTLANLVRALAEHEVRFVLIGGLAVAVHGYPRATKDADIVFDPAIENAERLAAALATLGAETVAADLPEPAQGITGEWLSQGGHFVFNTDSGGLDALSVARGKTYVDLVPNAVRAELADGVTVLACSYDDLVEAKQAAGRPQDLADLEGLRAVNEDSG